MPVDTLRAWERRHGLVAPGRDERGRLYSEADVRKLRLVRGLVERGHAVGRLAALSDADLAALERGVGAPSAPAPWAGAAAAVDLGAIVDAIQRFDAAGAEQELRRLATLLPPRELVHAVALPLMRAVGEAWLAGRLGIAQEHLASAALRNLLGSLVRVHAPARPAAALLFATPPGEQHEFGILAGAMLAVGAGVAAVYLGADLPPREIAAAAARTGARAVVLGVLGARGGAEPARAVAAVAAELPRGVELWVGGTALPEIVAAVDAAGGRFLPDFAAYEAELRRVGGAP